MEEVNQCYTNIQNLPLKTAFKIMDLNQYRNVCYIEYNVRSEVLTFKCLHYSTNSMNCRSVVMIKEKVLQRDVL